MKKYFNIRMLIITIAGISILSSCEKKNDNEPSEASSNPKVDKIDPGKAASNEVLIITGSGIGGVTSIYLQKDSVPVSFNSNFNTATSLVIRVPTDAVPGEQNLLFKNSSGVEFSVPFNVLGFVTVTGVSDYNFSTGTNITITGKNMADISKVTFAGSTTELQVVSKTATSVVVKFPSTELNVSKLDITNEAGVTTTTEEFVNYEKAFKLFAEDYAAGYQDASWGNAGFISSTEFKTGSKSYGKVYAAGNWHQMGFGYTNIEKGSYRYISFYIKGASRNLPLWISTTSSTGGFASFNEDSKIDVPANVWTYFKIPVEKAGLWTTGATFSQIGWRIQGPEVQDETFYLDDVLLIK